jgi:transposase
MAGQRNLKYDILKLRTEGKSYRDIQKLLQCSKSVVGYHCQKNEATDTGMKKHPISPELKKQISEYCKSNKLSDASKHFNLSISTINRHKNYQE